MTPLVLARLGRWFQGVRIVARIVVLRMRLIRQCVRTDDTGVLGAGAVVAIIIIIIVTIITAERPTHTKKADRSGRRKKRQAGKR